MRLTFIAICAAIAWQSVIAAEIPATRPSADLDLGARVAPVPLDSKFSDPQWHIWCGAPTRTADGKCHLYYSRWPVTEGFAPAWAIHSEIAYAVADQPQGPYRFVNIALPARGKEFWDGAVTHNPNVLQKDGKFYLFYMGNNGDGKYPTHRNNQRIGVAVAEKPEGPWKRFDKPIIDINPDKSAFDSLCVTNPAAAVRPDGGILVIYKAVQYVEGKPMGGRVRYGAALADTPEGPYTKTAGDIFEVRDKEADKAWMLAEDPFIWFSKKYGNQYYAVARDVIGKFTGDAGGIALFCSADGLHWRAAAEPKVIGKRFQWADGSSSMTQLERPAVLLDGDEPIMLFGAAGGYSKTPSYNVQIPLNAPAVGK
jgi:hypothetical protein